MENRDTLQNWGRLDAVSAKEAKKQRALATSTATEDPK